MNHKVNAIAVCALFPALLTARLFVAMWRVAKDICISVRNEQKSISRNCTEFFAAVGHKWRNQKCKHGRVIGIQACRHCDLARIYRRRKEDNE